MLDWVSQNKEWLFSGALIAVPLFIFGLRLRKPHDNTSMNIHQRSGKNSTAKVTSKAAEISIDQQAKGNANVKISGSDEA